MPPSDLQALIRSIIHEELRDLEQQRSTVVSIPSPPFDRRNLMKRNDETDKRCCGVHDDTDSISIPALCYAPAAAPWTLSERAREPLSVQVCHDQGRWTPWEAVLFSRRAELPLAASGRDGTERPRSAVLRTERRRTSPSATASAGEHGAETLDLSPAAAGRKRDVNGVMAVARAAGQPPPASSPVYAGRFSVARKMRGGRIDVVPDGCCGPQGVEPWSRAVPMASSQRSVAGVKRLASVERVIALIHHRGSAHSRAQRVGRRSSLARAQGRLAILLLSPRAVRQKRLLSSPH
ncbi:hypothetical protein HPB51_016722 [Rhipicephalus microplus]|uniref:Uncharacterized protein n=1 Tax=Rhipicephalus microplus TaxID=6941 RepID=A0A9J6DAD9_RHIMP|nr:hypothetical protein HPB51_016722 [Rhipicephalus microplus]